jgi:hypothetical protein
MAAGIGVIVAMGVWMAALVVLAIDMNRKK